jgi:2'-5' RNA ligase
MAQQRRVFLALWPDDEVAATLVRLGQAAAEACGGRAMRRETLHMTLAFIGNVREAQLDALQRIAGAAAGPRFDLVLDEMAWWRHNRIVWVGARVVPQALAELTLRLGAGLRGGEFRVEDRPFAAHVTLLRNARCPDPPALPAPLVWSVTQFVLVESLLRPQGAEYRHLVRFPLAQ